MGLDHSRFGETYTTGDRNPSFCWIYSSCLDFLLANETKRRLVGWVGLVILHLLVDVYSILSPCTFCFLSRVRCTLSLYAVYTLFSPQTSITGLQIGVLVGHFFMWIIWVALGTEWSPISLLRHRHAFLRNSTILIVSSTFRAKHLTIKL